MKKLFLLIFTIIAIPGMSQDIDLEKIAKDIAGEGKRLYRLELAAWYGSDIFKDSFQSPERIGGYFSYLESDKPKCLFFSKEENPKVIGVVTFGDIQIVETATIDFKERDFKEKERDLYIIRMKALQDIQQDTLYKNYNNANLNLIPLIDRDRKEVYILTGPKVTGTVLFGNDYLLSFDRDNNLIDRKQIHRNLIPMPFQQENGDSASTAHSHAPETGDFITPTDICTLMLYAKFAGWKQHLVVSQSYVSIWDCEKEELEIITWDEFEENRMSNK
jgi:hypothetical protein